MVVVSVWNVGHFDFPKAQDGVHPLPEHFGLSRMGHRGGWLSMLGEAEWGSRVGTQYESELMYIDIPGPALLPHPDR